MRDPSDWFKDKPWTDYPRRNEFEMAGYFHLFHAGASSIQKYPWYGVDWMHAGGCDSVFQERFPAEKKIRLDFDTIHLGEPDVNWLGRATKRTDGTMPDNAEELRKNLAQMIKTRRKFGKHDNRRYVHEKVKTGAPVVQQTAAKRK